MILQHGITVFPECAGLPIFCQTCRQTTYAEATISVSLTREKKEGGQEIVQFLVCYPCATDRADTIGSC